MFGLLMSLTLAGCTMTSTSIYIPHSRYSRCMCLKYLRFLVASGVDAVKCDVEATIDEFDDGAVRQRLGRAYQDAFKLYSLKWFSRRVIYCKSTIAAIRYEDIVANISSRHGTYSLHIFPFIAAS